MKIWFWIVLLDQWLEGLELGCFQWKTLGLPVIPAAGLVQPGPEPHYV